MTASRCPRRWRWPSDARIALSIGLPFEAIAVRQPAAQYHLMNRSGALPFHEEPEAFHHIVASFQDGVAAERAGR